jgi:hypothetical protein
LFLVSVQKPEPELPNIFFRNQWFLFVFLSGKALQQCASCRHSTAFFTPHPLYTGTASSEQQTCILEKIK